MTQSSPRHHNTLQEVDRLLKRAVCLRVNQKVQSQCKFYRDSMNTGSQTIESAMKDLDADKLTIRIHWLDRQLFQLEEILEETNLQAHSLAPRRRPLLNCNKDQLFKECQSQPLLSCVSLSSCSRTFCS